MPDETYVPSIVQFGGRVLPGGYLCVLYECEGSQRRGSLTIPSPPRAGERGALRLIGSRDDRLWDVSLGEVVIVAHSAIGCEFVTGGPVRVTPLEKLWPANEHSSIDQPHGSGRASNLPHEANGSVPDR